MSTFRPNDKVICISPPASMSNPPTTSFPDGQIEEGEIYCVESVRNLPGKPTSLVIVGKAAWDKHRETGWDARHFHKLSPRKSNLAAKSKQHLLGRPVRTLVHRI